MREAWLEKPLIRSVEVTERSPEPYLYYPLSTRSTTEFRSGRIDALLVDLEREAGDEKIRLIGLIGAGGTGKSWFAHKLTQSLQDKKPGFEGYFFWSSYYSHDALTGLDRALAYLDPENRQKGDRIERFRKCLSTGRYLLVFDGIERLLQEVKNPIEGKGFTILADKLLAAMIDDESVSTVVITSRLWPAAFGPLEGKDGSIRSHLIPRYRSTDIAGVEPFSSIDSSRRSALVSLLDGHVHALVLAAEMLRNPGPEGIQPKLRAHQS